jgi:hypothetical protein
LLAVRFDDVRLLGQGFNHHVRVSPFLDDQQRLPRTLINRGTILTWRVLNKAPAALRDRLSRAFWGHTLYLTESDYRFDEELVEAAPVIVAVMCRPEA